AFLAALDGSCRTPIAGYARLLGGRLVFDGMIVTPDGRTAHAARRAGAPDEAAALGTDGGAERKGRGGPGVAARRGAMRVLLTRPRADAEATAERVAALGHAAVIAPLLDIVPESGQPDLAGAGALIVTSANALRVLPASALRSVRGLPLFAVGARTAAAARACGFADVRSAAGDAEALLALILSASPQGTLVHLAGRDRAGELVPRLAAAGFTARVATVYRAMALDRL